MGCQCLARLQSEPNLGKQQKEQEAKATRTSQTKKSEPKLSSDQKNIGQSQRTSDKSKRDSKIMRLSNAKSHSFDVAKASKSTEALDSSRSVRSNQSNQSKSFTNDDYNPCVYEYSHPKYIRTTKEHGVITGKKRVTARYQISKTHIMLETSFK